MVTTSQINSVTSARLLFQTILYLLSGGPSVDSGGHWGDAIADSTDDHWFDQPWFHRAILWWLWHSPTYQAGRHAVCTLTDAEHLTMTVEDLGSQMSISRNTNETDLAWGKRMLVTQLASETGS